MPAIRGRGRSPVSSVIHMAWRPLFGQCGGGAWRYILGDYLEGGRPMCCGFSPHQGTAWRWVKRLCSSSRKLGGRFRVRCRAGGTVGSKMRLSRPWCGFVGGNVWLDNAAMPMPDCKKTSRWAGGLPGVELRYPRQVNGVFVRLPAHRSRTALRAKAAVL